MSDHPSRDDSGRGSIRAGPSGELLAQDRLHDAVGGAREAAGDLEAELLIEARRLKGERLQLHEAAGLCGGHATLARRASPPSCPAHTERCCPCGIAAGSGRGSSSSAQPFLDEELREKGRHMLVLLLLAILGLIGVVPCLLYRNAYEDEL